MEEDILFSVAGTFGADGTGRTEYYKTSTIEVAWV